ncbi:septum site-determining protein MinC [Vibrio sp. RC27]
MSTSPDLKGSSFTLSVLHLADNEITNVVDFLKEKVAQAPAFFSSAPIVIDISQVEEDIDYHALKDGISQAGLIPVGITGFKDKRIQEEATNAGLAVLKASKTPKVAIEEPAEKPVPRAQVEAAPVQASEPEMIPTKIIRTPIRSGQQIYAKNCDLMIFNNVGAGAEVIADGSIHIYGTLRGRAIAGAKGHKDATIICSDLQAELISIAGNYWVSDQIGEELWQKHVVVTTTTDTLNVDLLTV